MFGYCPKCHQMKHLTDHHVYTKRFYRRSDCKLKLCRDCHDDIERVIPLRTKLSKETYLKITKAWLLGKAPKVIMRWAMLKHKTFRHWLQHNFNSLHVMCRLRRFMPLKLAKRIAKVYEKIVHPIIYWCVVNVQARLTLYSALFLYGIIYLHSISPNNTVVTPNDSTGSEHRSYLWVGVPVELIRQSVIKKSILHSSQRLSKIEYENAKSISRNTLIT